MNRKILIGLISIFAIVGTVGAWSVGNVYTSSQLKSINISEEPICEFVDAGRFDDDVLFYFNCVHLRRISGDAYEVIGKNLSVSYSFNQAQQCVQQYNKDYCWNNVVKPEVLSRIRFIVAEIREDLIRIQENAASRVFNPGVYNFTLEEINSP